MKSRTPKTVIPDVSQTVAMLVEQRARGTLRLSYDAVNRTNTHPMIRAHALRLLCEGK